MSISPRLREAAGGITAEVSRVVIGKDEIKTLLLAAMLSEGHVLIEGLPGTGKTTLASAFAQAIGGTFKRVQGTPDTLPADILGFYLYRAIGEAQLISGPVFANVVLVDELNRLTPRAQSALLEAMQEHQVTIERETHVLERPFIVIAAQVPRGGGGTSPLTEVQADRFMFRLWSGLPGGEEEDGILRNVDDIMAASVSPACAPADVLDLQARVRSVHVAGSIRAYMIDLCRRLRQHADVQLGPSPRGSIALFKGARAVAFMEGRDFVLPDDVKMLALPALSHRVHIGAEAEMDGISPEGIIEAVLSEAPVPTVW